MENRGRYNAAHNLALPTPACLRIVVPHHEDNLKQVQEDQKAYINDHHFDVIVADTSGSDTPLSRYAHNLADVLVSPIYQ